MTGDYVDDGVFGGLAASNPSIFPIHWSKPQAEARADAGMAAVRGFLNSRTLGDQERSFRPHTPTELTTSNDQEG